ncbi:hypothetical protein HJFPF1_13418 [Paramyrothecium foliicola]|nr:hypothetical protein HJFPF1_13418 [Paramyrothecium foliicola]
MEKLMEKRGSRDDTGLQRIAGKFRSSAVHPLEDSGLRGDGFTYAVLGGLARIQALFTGPKNHGRGLSRPRLTMVQ